LLTIKEPKFNLFNGSSFRKLTTETISDVAIGPIYFMKGIQLGSNSYSLITIDELRQYRKILVKFKNLNLQTEKEREGIDKQRLNIPFRLSPNMFKISNDGKALFSAGHWDNSFKITSLDQNISNEQSVLEHKSRVTCVSLTENVLVTGSVDTSILVWKIVGKKNLSYKIKENKYPPIVLSGHSAEITTVEADYDLDICISGSSDGQCLMYNLKKGEFINQIFHPNKLPIDKILISKLGCFIIYSKGDFFIRVYNFQGTLLCSKNINEHLNDMVISPKGDYFITGGKKRNDIYQIYI